jgi:hypothetical protein
MAVMITRIKRGSTPIISTMSGNEVRDDDPKW